VYKCYPIVGPFWFQRFVYPRHPAPLTETGLSQEREFPWREGRIRVFRMPLTRSAIALGKWTGEQDHENVDGIPTLTFRQLDHPEDYFHAVLDEDPPAF
jgi:hypothetical protein